MLLAVTKGINKGVHRQHLYGVDKRAEAGACLYPDGVWHMRPLPHLPAYVLIHTQSVNVLLEGLSVVLAGKNVAFRGVLCVNLLQIITFKIMLKN